MKDLQPWNEAEFYPSSFKSEDDGQLTIFFDNNEPPDPHDYPTIKAFDEAFEAWESSITGNTEPLKSEPVKPEQSSITEQTNQKQGVIELSSGCLNTYRKKGHYYWRFSYREGKKVKHIHLCPANSHKPRHTDLMNCVRELMAKKADLDNICEVIELMKNLD